MNMTDDSSKSLDESRELKNLKTIIDNQYWLEKLKDWFDRKRLFVEFIIRT